jgi:actin-like ATPase involved in cell morphogenesis
MAHDLVPVGVDVGYGDVKVVGPDGRRHSFPSRWAPHRATAWGIGATARVLALDGGEPFAVGEAADGLPGVREPQADGRLADPATLPLLAAALSIARLPDGAEVALGGGLPLGRYDQEAPAAREALRGRTLVIGQGKDVRRVTIRKVVLRPQGVGAALHLVATGALHARSGLVLVVDVGSRTTDVLALHARTLEPIPELSGSLALGVGDAAAGLAQEIAAQAGFVPPPSLAREALAREAVYRGKTYGGPRMAAPHLDVLAGRVSDGLRSLLREPLDSVSALALVGGGAVLLGSRLAGLPGERVRCPAGDLPYANALGYRLAAERALRRAVS